MISLPPAEAHIGFHIMAFLLILAAPLAGWFVTARIKASGRRQPGGRLLAYRLAIGSLLAGTVAVFLLVPPTTFFYVPIQNRGVDWLPSRELISLLAVALVLITALPVMLARRSGPLKASLEEQLRELHDLLPQSQRERLWFALAVSCAGVCEEVLYRAFLLHYLHVFPWRLNIATSLLVACAVFGVVHLYHGVSGLLQHILMALGLCVLFLTTRSLLVPMVLHLLISLRLVMVLPNSVAVQKRA